MFKRLNRSGYIEVRPPVGAWVKEHRYVMEQALNRPLVPGEDVHHINFAKWDNRPENLVVATGSEHASMKHGPGPPPPQSLLDEIRDSEVAWDEYVEEARRRDAPFRRAAFRRRLGLPRLEAPESGVTAEA